MLSINSQRSLSADSQETPVNPLGFWQSAFRTLGFTGLVATAIWLAIAATLFGEAKPFDNLLFDLFSERTLRARADFYGALTWAFIGLCSAATNFFFAALMAAAIECIRLLRSIAASAVR